MRFLKDGETVVILSGAGLSAPSGIPTFRGADGLWEGHDVRSVATPEAWQANRELVRRFYDERRLALVGKEPNAGHRALARLQREAGPERVFLVTQNIDGLLTAAGCPDVIEMHGSLRQLRCELDEDHPWHPVEGAQSRTAQCPVCGGLLRPAVVWFGEVPLHMERIGRALRRCALFLSVGTSGLVYPAAGFVRNARMVGAHCIEVNPNPSGAAFDQEIEESADTALPRLVDAWLG